MPMHSPSATVHTLVAAMNRGDLDAALACYATDAVFVAAPGQTVRTPAAIREAIGSLLALKPILATIEETIVEAGDTALYHSVWTMRGHDPSGVDVSMAGRSSDVLRRHADGHWEIVVDNPWGTAVLDPVD
jgi:uncharacterized protein (TIGR02246 family)